MMLRASAKATETTIDVQAVVDTGTDSQIPHGEALSVFAEALVRRSPNLGEARNRVVQELGPQQLVEAAGTAANFQRMTRIADAIGIPLDEAAAQHGVNMRAQLGIDQFAGAANTQTANA